jgi:hypothetical protein
MAAAADLRAKGDSKLAKKAAAELDPPPEPSWWGQLIVELVNQTADTFADRLAWLRIKGFSGEDALAINAGAVAYKEKIDSYFSRQREQRAEQEKRNANRMEKRS